MGLDKGINHGKEHRKQYRGAKAVDKSCRNHGSDDWARANREYRANRENERTQLELTQYMRGETDMGYDLKELREKLADVERTQFIHEMKDRWDAADYSYARTLDEKIADLKEKIKGMESLGHGND